MPVDIQIEDLYRYIFMTLLMKCKFPLIVIDDSSEMQTYIY